jgi:hypothetical protein
LPPYWLHEADATDPAPKTTMESIIIITFAAFRCILVDLGCPVVALLLTLAGWRPSRAPAPAPVLALPPCPSAGDPANPSGAQPRCAGNRKIFHRRHDRQAAPPSRPRGRLHPARQVGAKTAAPGGIEWRMKKKPLKNYSSGSTTIQTLSS